MKPPAIDLHGGVAAPNSELSNVSLVLPPEALERIAVRAAELAAARLEDREPRSDWLDVGEAAAHMRCGRQRVYDLVSAGRLRVAKDGSRSLFRREWLDAYLLGEAGS